MTVKSAFYAGFHAGRAQRREARFEIFPYLDTRLEEVAHEAALVVVDDIAEKFALTDAGARKIAHRLGGVLSGADLSHDRLDTTKLRGIARDLAAEGGR